MIKLELVQTDKHSTNDLLRLNNLRFLRRTNHIQTRWQQLQMKTEYQKIINLIYSYLEKYLNLRFTQALFNKDINQKPDSPDKLFDGVLRDNYGDKDSEVLKIISGHLKNFNN